MEFIRHLLVWRYSPPPRFSIWCRYVYRPEIEFKKINRLICSLVWINLKCIFMASVPVMSTMILCDTKMTKVTIMWDRLVVVVILKERKKKNVGYYIKTLVITRKLLGHRLNIISTDFRSMSKISFQTFQLRVFVFGLLKTNLCAQKM